MELTKRYLTRFDILNPKTKQLEPWTGIFYSKESEVDWINNSYNFWINKGKILIKMICHGEKWKKFQGKINIPTETS